MNGAIEILINHFVRLGALALLAFIAFVQWETRDNGRYVLRERSENLNWTILDTRTGMLYVFAPGKDGGAGAWFETNPHTAESIQRNAKSK